MIAIQFPASRQGVWFRVLYDVLRTHNTFRDEDSLSDKGNLCDYVAMGHGGFFTLGQTCQECGGGSSGQRSRGSRCPSD